MYKVKFQPGFRKQLRELQSPQLALAVRQIASELTDNPTANARKIGLDIGPVYLRDIGAEFRLVYRVYSDEKVVLVLRLI